MTSADPYELYPQYCFHLSPTINRWCPFQAIDIQALKSHSGFEGQDVFFRLNHPIKWVRIVGVVVAINENHGWRVYTIDDSTGACIDCQTRIPATLPEPSSHNVQTSKDDQQTTMADNLAADVGMVLDIKGGLKSLREEKIVTIEKMEHIRSTNQEVKSWAKIAEFRKDVLSKPWMLDRKEVRRCRKEAEGENVANTSKRQKLLSEDVTRRGSSRTQKDGRLRQKERELAAKQIRARKQATGDYSALGL